MKNSFAILATVLVCSAASFAGVTIGAPANGATVTSPAHLAASASASHPITSMAVLVDGTRVLLGYTSSLNDFVWMPAGAHTITVQAQDSSGAVFKSTRLVNVVSTSSPLPLSNIEDMSTWQWCTRQWNGLVCASGLGNAVSWMAGHQTSPSLDGASSEFYIGGSTGYSNALWWKSLGGGASPSHFKYDFWVYIQQPQLSQALEFDVNQSFSNGTRYVWGSECNFKADHAWDVWDGGTKKWIQTALGCPVFPANKWIHFTWNLERVNGKMHYISLVVNGVTHSLNLYMNPETSYIQSGAERQDINVAFQMDGDYRQDPYYVWLDKVSLTAW
jgi:hypothetical protein